MKRYVRISLIYNIMCSIIGYFGHDEASPILVRGLGRMEYRGYDSVGVITCSDNKLTLKKGVGKVSEVNTNLGLDLLHGSTGIGHTRWATHGKVTDKNAHPHLSNSGKIAIVHNGIIENFEELKSNLQNKGFDFQSETDTEVIANLIQLNFDESSDIKQSIIKTVAQLKGHYSFVVMFEDGTLAAARFHEPLIVGVGKDSYYLSSDVLGFIERTDDAIYVDNEDFAIVNNDGIQIFDFDGTPTKHQITKVSKEFADVYKTLVKVSPKYTYSMFEVYVRAFCEGRLNSLLPFTVSKFQGISDNSFAIQNELLTGFTTLPKSKKFDVLKFFSKFT